MTLPITAARPVDEAVAVVEQWVVDHVPAAWREAAARGGASAIREVRSRADYAAWYPTFAASGLVVPTWPMAYGGLDVSPSVARAIESVLAPYNLGRLNPLGLNLAAPALFTHGTEEQRLRFLPPIVRNEEAWCQLFSEPGAGSDLASLATRAERDGDTWVLTGQKVWTTWAHWADFGVCLARTDPDVPKRQGITYFLVDMHAPGVDVRPLRHIGGEVDFNEVFLDGVRVPDGHRVGEVGAGWTVANATLSGERQMVSGAGSGGVDRVGGAGARRLVTLARRVAAPGRGWADPVMRHRIMRVYSEERIRAWTNQRVRAGLRAGRPPGPASSVGKVHQGELNQRIQEIAVDLLGAGAIAWDPPTPPPGGSPDGRGGQSAPVGSASRRSADDSASQTGSVSPSSPVGSASRRSADDSVSQDGPVSRSSSVGEDDLVGRSDPVDDNGPGARVGPVGPDAYAASLPYEVEGMLRSRANTIEGGTTEVNKNVVGERVLGLPREPDPHRGLPWREVPRS